MKVVIVTGLALTFIKQDLPVRPLQVQVDAVVRMINNALAAAPGAPQLTPTDTDLKITEEEQ